MDLDKYQQAWKAHSSETRVTVDADSLLNAVQRSQQELRKAVSWGDITAIGAELAMLPVFLFLGVLVAPPWTWYLIVAAIIWGAGVKLVVRARRKQPLDNPAEPLLSGVRESLALVEYQIWSQRNTFWCSQLPTAITMMIFFLHVTWLSSQNWWEALGFAIFFFLIVLTVYGFTYYLSKLVERKHHEPRRQELITLLASLSDDSTSEVSGEYPLLMSGKLAAAACDKPSPRRLLVAGVCFVVLLAIGVGGAYFASGFDEGYPKKAPFAGVRWQESQPEVNVDGEWVRLVLLNNIPAAEIVAFSQRTYGTKWQKRFEEDLVELLTRMGHPPQDTVTLTLQSLATAEVWILRDVPMTKANRRAIRKAAQAREGSEEQQVVLPTVPVAEESAYAEVPAQALESIRAAYALPAMASFVIRDGVIVEQATVGTRSSKDNTPIADDAPWHLGGNTTAMTATLAGILVEEDLLQWDATLGEVLGDAAPDMDTGHRETTLAMLLQHTGGITPNIDWYAAPEDRVACAAQILSSPPVSQPGSYAYSNAGYVVAGAMMEVVTGQRWEDLMIEKLFEPLGMKDTSFGAPSTPNAPWGHRSGVFGWSPRDPTTYRSDNAPVFGPAGTVHGTLNDFARFLAAHMAGTQGKDGIVTAETFRMLHTPPEGGKYAMGWSIVERGWAGGQALMCGGTNTLWYAAAWLAPEKDMAFFGVTNVGGDSAFAAVNEAIESLIDRNLGLHPASPTGDPERDGVSPEVEGS